MALIRINGIDERRTDARFRQRPPADFERGTGTLLPPDALQRVKDHVAKPGAGGLQVLPDA